MTTLATTPACPPDLRARIRVAEAFVSRAICDEIVRSVDHTALLDGTITSVNQPPAARTVDKKVRNVLIHDSVPFHLQVNAVVQKIVDELIEPFYGIQVDYWEIPDILVYPPGGFYRPHNDGEAVVHDPERYVWEWRRSMDRDISVVWYLNEDFEGGELVFLPSQLSIRPASGMVVTFPSTHEYAHTAQPVSSGMRYAVVTWMAAVGTPRTCAPVARVQNRSWQ
jgi:predicted 2-oxoglutarate/Fe(II)-dependent dioxygenase YbiX